MVSPICIRCGHPVAVALGHEAPRAPGELVMHTLCERRPAAQQEEQPHWILRVMDWLDGDAGDRFVALACAFSAGAVCALAWVGML